MYLETKFNPNQEQQDFINFVLSDNFINWSINDRPVPTDDKDYITMIHPILSRKSSYISSSPLDGEIVSEYYYQTKDIFNTICNENNISINKIYRMAFNTTIHYEDKYNGIHVDHPFEHVNFLLYLNNFTNGNTYLFDENNNITKKIKPEKNKAVFFQGKHAQGFCKPHEKRVVLVVTFKG